MREDKKKIKRRQHHAGGAMCFYWAIPMNSTCFCSSPTLHAFHACLQIDLCSIFRSHLFSIFVFSFEYLNRTVFFFSKTLLSRVSIHTRITSHLILHKTEDMMESASLIYLITTMDYVRTLFLLDMENIMLLMWPFIYGDTSVFDALSMF